MSAAPRSSGATIAASAGERSRGNDPQGRFVAAAWARTLAGIGLIGGCAALAALLWLAVERSVGRAPQEETAVRRARKFVAVIGILLALVCLPFAAAIHASAHTPWLG